MNKYLILTAMALSSIVFSCKKKTTSKNETSCNPGTTNLVANLKFSGSLTDETGNVTGSTSTGLAYDADKLSTASAAASFNGTTSYVALPNLFDTDVRSISFWFKATTYPSGSNPNDLGVLMVYDFPALKNGFIAAYVQKVSGVNTLKLQIASNSATAEINMDAEQNALGWNHVVMVQNKTTATFYLNGKQVGNSNIPSYITSVDGMQNLIIGTNRGANGRFYSGEIDQLKIYNKALNSCEADWLSKNY